MLTPRDNKTAGAPRGRVSRLFLSGLLIAALLLTACGRATDEQPPTAVPVTVEQVEVTVVVTRLIEATPQPTVEPIRSKDLVICMAEEPDTLFPYGSTLPAARAVRQAIFEEPITNLSYDYQARSLEKLPSLADGDALINAVVVSTGDRVMTAVGLVKELAVGDVVMTAAGDEAVFDGTPLEMHQMVVDFAMKPTVYADGTPALASDSVYSFELAASAANVVTDPIVSATQRYEATGDLSTRWTGLPGFISSTYFLHYWPPYPEHLWGDLSPAELAASDEARRKPIGDGPFRLVEWRPGDRIRLVRNPYYYRAAAGLPRLDSVIFKFIPDPDQMLVQLLAGQCHIATSDGLSLDQAPVLIQAEAAGRLVTHFQAGTLYEHIDFNINPYGDYAESRYDWFEDVNVRRAMTHCTDRQGMIDEILFGRSQIIHAYVPVVHPLYSETGLTEYAYDPAAGNRLLDAAGYDQRDAGGFRLGPDGKRFAPRLGTTAGNALRQQLVGAFVDDMAVCGIDVRPYYVPATDWFADGPDGELFGRRYDLGAFAWSAENRPVCETYLSSQIPGPAGELNEVTGGIYTGWGGQNQAGYFNPDFDAACRAALGALPGMPEYDQYHAEALTIFAQDVPVIPLFMRVRVSAALPSVVGFSADSTHPSEVYNLEELDLR